MLPQPVEACWHGDFRFSSSLKLPSSPEVWKFPCAFKGFGPFERDYPRNSESYATDKRWILQEHVAAGKSRQGKTGAEKAT